MIVHEPEIAAAPFAAAYRDDETQEPQCSVLAADSQPRSRRHSSNRNHQCPVPVEATVYWWRIGERKSLCTANQFGVIPATPVRFRCIGTITPKHPKRYRVELAQALDWMPELTRRELKDLGASLALAVSEKLGVEVATFNWEVIDLDH